MSFSVPLMASPRLQLRQFMPEDVGHVYKGLSHPEVIRYYGVSYRTLEETETQMQWFRELESSGTGTWWAIWSADGKNFMGAAGFNNLCREHCKAELGFWLLPAYWGKGFITEALNIIIPYGFDQLQLHRIEAFVETGNTSSCQALLRQGFCQEGTMQDCEIKNEKFISLHVFAKISINK
jgi:ribosomal-protein-alanine N-acetyltransferase